MKTTTKNIVTIIKLFSLIYILLFLNHSNSRAQCSANFVSANLWGGVFGFTSTSVGTNSTTSYSWNFGNGTSSVGINLLYPYSTYTASGTYTISLTINGLPACNSVFITTITIPPCQLTANFMANDIGNGAVQFWDLSSGVAGGATYLWNYGDNSTGNAVNPAHTYSANGNYTATLTINNSPTCVSTKTMVVTVSSYCNLIVGFTASSGTLGLTNFVSTSTGTTNASTYSWTFGNGATGNGITSSHVYANNGTYSVTLTVNNTGPFICTNSITQTITVSSSSCNISANFATTNGANGLVNFNNTSTGLNAFPTYTWNFGDGITSNVANPIHTYASAGIFTVNLTVNDAIGCATSITKTVNISNIPCLANANFTLVPTNTPTFWNAIPSYPWNVVNATWSWGNGQSTNSLYCSHLYSVAATYTVCLTVTVSCGTVTSTCSSYFINKSAAPNLALNIISINVIAPEIISQETGLLDLNNENVTFNFYPNPSQGEINLISLSSESIKYSIIDITGRKVLQGEFIKNKTLDTSNLQSGTYFIRFELKSSHYYKKLVVEK